MERLSALVEIFCFDAGCLERIGRFWVGPDIRLSCLVP